MKSRVSSQGDTTADLNMPTHAEVIGQGVMIAHLYVVPQVAVGHQEVVIPDLGEPSTLWGTPRERNPLSKDVTRTTDEPPLCIAPDLSGASNDTEGVQPAFRPQLALLSQDGVGLQDATGTHSALGTHAGAGVNLCAGVNSCAGVDVHRGSKRRLRRARRLRRLRLGSAGWPL